MTTVDSMAVSTVAMNAMDAVDAWAGRWPSGAADEPLFGREEDLRRIGEFLAGVARVGGPLLLLGDSGVGKSALLAVVGRQAAAGGMCVLHTTGMPYKTQPGYCALAQLLRPADEDRGAENQSTKSRSAAGARTGRRHTEALAAALGSGAGPAPEYDAVADAVLSLIADLSRVRPTLLVIDDMQWLDRPSAVVLGLVARRLAGSGAGMLCAAKPGTESFFDYSDLPTHDLLPLSDAASEQLLTHRFPALAARVRRRLMSEAEGNPLALLELPVPLTDPQRAATAALPARLTLSSKLQAAFASRITALPAATRRLLLIAALEGSGDLQALRRAVAGRCSLKHLAPAEHAQLVRVDDAAGRLHFRHSLTRAAVVELSSSDQRRSAHRALADAWAAVPERQAWHLAQAAIAPDERIATLLESAAAVAGARGDGPEAVAALLRAADLSPEAAARARRLAEAAYLSANITGDLRDVPHLLEDARRAAPEGNCPNVAVAGSAYLLNGFGDLDTAHRLLSGSIALAPEPYDPANSTLFEALSMLQMVCFYGGRPQQWRAFDDALGKYGAAPRLLRLIRSLFADPARATAADLAALDEEVARLPSEDDPMHIVRVATAGVYTDRVGECAQALERVAQGARVGENIVPAIHALFLLCDHALVTGEWSRLRQLAQDGLGLCAEYHYPMLAWHGRFLLAYTAAIRGDLPAARSLADQMDQWAGPRRAEGLHGFTAHVRTQCALAQGDFEAAYRHATLVAPAGTLPRFRPHALWVILDLVEAAVRTGRRRQAQAHVAAAREAGIARLSPRLRMLVMAATALASDDEHPGLVRALAVEGAERWPFALARIRLYHGERLRRGKAAVQAREHLAAAAQLFTRLGAAPWADARRRNCARAADSRSRRCGPAPPCSRRSSGRSPA